MPGAPRNPFPGSRLENFIDDGKCITFSHTTDLSWKLKALYMSFYPLVIPINPQLTDEEAKE